MARRKPNLIEKAAAQLVGGKPIAVHYRADGTLVVLDERGRKKIFAAEEVKRVVDGFLKTKNEAGEAK
jgi:hypothetical protein